ncbi:MAG: prefoldin subunit beta [Candidatus Pacearchaeota archaeon]
MDQQKLQEMQILEQNLQNSFMQRQSFEMELSETQAGLEELKSSDEDAFKIIGQLMVKTDRKKVIEELSNKVKILEMRLDSLSKQESSLMEKLENMRAELSEK